MLSQEMMREMEVHSPLIKLARMFTVPILNALPASLIQKMMRASSHDAAMVVAKGGSTHALDNFQREYILTSIIVPPRARDG